MALMYYVGGVPVTEEEANQKIYSGEYDQLAKAVESGSNFSLNVENGQIRSEDFQVGSFKKIGIGKPLKIEILTLYTGKAPKKFLGKKDLLLVSGVKSPATFKAAPKAINQIIKKIEDKTHYEPSAFNNGSPIVYYTPAAEMGKILCSFEMVADTFNEETFENVSGLLKNAGGIPVLAIASTVLFAGGILSGLIGKLGKAIFESKAFFRDDLKINFDSAGEMISVADYGILVDPRHQSELKNYEPKLIDLGAGQKGVRLINKATNAEYDGDAPYILISIDGKENERLKNFKPTIANAALLEEFYGAENSQAQTINTIEDALNDYNNLRYYIKAKKVKKNIEGLEEDSEEYKKMKILFDTYVKNIVVQDGEDEKNKIFEISL